MYNTYYTCSKSKPFVEYKSKTEPQKRDDTYGITVVLLVGVLLAVMFCDFCLLNTNKTEKIDSVRSILWWTEYSFPFKWLQPLRQPTETLGIVSKF